MASFTPHVDEFIIGKDKLHLLKHCQSKIAKLFNITINYGKTGWEFGSKEVQWVGLEGENEDRRNAKEYIISLCMPEDMVRIPFPLWLASAICLPDALEKLETQTHAALIPCSNYEVSILGSQLAVTLAMSAFEDLIHRAECEFANSNVNAAMLELALRRDKSSGTHTAVKNATDIEKQSGSIPLRSPASARLNMLLERAISENCDGMSKPEDYLNTPDLVKRVMVGCLTEPDDTSSHGSCIVRDLFPDAGNNRDESVDKGGGSVTVSPMQQAVKGISGKLQGVSLGDPTDCNPVIIDICGIEEVIVLDDSPVVSRTRSKTKEKVKEMNSQIKPQVDDSVVAAIKDSQKVADYWQKLARDFHEESDLSVEEMRKRKEARLKVLMDYFEEEKKKGRLAGADIGVIAFQQKQEPLVEAIGDTVDCGTSQRKNRKKRRKNAKKKQSVVRNIEVKCEPGVSSNSPVRQKMSPDRSSSSSNDSVIILGSDTEDIECENDDESSSPLNRSAETRVLEVWSSPALPRPAKQRATFDTPGRISSPKQKDLATVKDVSPVPKACEVDNVDAGRHTSRKIRPDRRDVKLRGDAHKHGAMFPDLQVNVSNDPFVPPLPPPDIRPPLPFGTPPPSPCRREKTTYVDQPIPPPLMHVQPKAAPQRPPPHVAPSTRLRYIVIDGSNVAMSHGNNKVFSCRGIRLCVDYFLKLGHTEITAFVPQWRQRSLSNAQYPIRDQHVLEELRNHGYLVFTPARRVEGRNIVCYDDRYVLNLAEETDGIIVTNDNYRDLLNEKTSWRMIIKERLLMFSYVRDIFMPPDDPLGKDGPTLEVFLRKPPANQFYRKRQHSPNRNQTGGNPSSQQTIDHQLPLQHNFQQQRWDQNTRNPKPIRWDSGHSNNYNPAHKVGVLPVPNQRQQLPPPWPDQVIHNYSQNQMYNSQQPAYNYGNRPNFPHAYSGPVAPPRAPPRRVPDGVIATGKPRSKEEHHHLFAILKNLFPNKDQEVKIQQVLNHHPHENNTNKLSNYIMSIIE